jgi:hypothetical protein
MVACRFTPQEGVDFQANDTFALVVRLASAHLILGLAACHGCPVHQPDVKSAYLSGKLRNDECIYMTPLPGICLNGLKPSQVLEFLLSIYGLKQAGQRWYAELWRVLGNIQLIRVEHDHAVFMHRHPDSTVSVISIHVDDMSLITTTHARMEELKKKIKQVFEVTNGSC